MERFLFPRWTNKFLLVVGIFAAGGALFAGPMFMGATDPVTLNIGYQPEQPVPYSHAIHAGTLKMDCRYCHNTVDKAAHASIPATQTCINCHSPKSPEGAPKYAAVHVDSAKLDPVHESWRTGESISWQRIHRLPDYVYFNHSAHVTKGVSCLTCHGRIDKMEVVYQAKQLSMAWCVDCHRNPDPHIRPTGQVTNLAWNPDDITEEEALEVEAIKNSINPMQNCAVCHR
jgi:hypothetical protein